MTILPPAPAGFEYSARNHNGEGYLTTGLFPVGAPNHTLEQLHRVRALVFDADLVDWILGCGQITDLEQKIGSLDPKEVKTWLHGVPRNEVEELLRRQRLDLLAAFIDQLGQAPTVVTISGYGHHALFWLSDDWGYADDDGPHGAVALRRANKQAVAAINGAVGYGLLDPKCVDTGTRLLREIGSFNTKGPEPVEVVAVIHEPSRLLEELPPLPDEPARSAGESPRTERLKGNLVVETADGAVRVRDFHSTAQPGDQVKAICPFSDSTSMGAAWLSRVETATFMFCGADHDHDHAQGGCARWIYAGHLFRRGDEVEIAEHVVATDLPADAVYDRGGIYSYDGEVGAWSSFESSEIERGVMAYAGSQVDGRDTTVLKLSYKKVMGVVSCMERLLHQRGFFDEAPFGIGFANGLLTADGELHPYAPEQRLQACHQLPFPYDQDAECPRWDLFLDEIFEGDDDASEKQDFLQEFIGAALMGRATAYQQHPLLWGPTASNGKTTLLEVVGELFPDSSRAASSPHDWGRSFEKTQLLNARINLVTELNEQELQDAGPIKAVLTGDSMQYERKYQDPVNFRPRAGHIFAVNSLPMCRDHTPGFYRRFVVLAFNRSFSEEERDTTLKDKLRTELPGIAAWAVRGAIRRAQADSYTIPPSAVAAQGEWRRDNDSVAYFAECCLERDEGAAMPSSELYQRYKYWAEDEGLRSCAHKAFSQRLEAIGYRKKRLARGQCWEARVAGAVM